MTTVTVQSSAREAPNGVKLFSERVPADPNQRNLFLLRRPDKKIAQI
jgi:hypothetical protein